MEVQFDYIKWMRKISIQELLLAVRRLPPRTAATDALHKSGYQTHQDHWLGWLGDYNDAEGGYYGRSDTTITDARVAYNRLSCAPMIIWLGEGLRLPPATINQALLALRTASMAGKNEAAKAAAVRRVIPWEMVAARL